MKAFFEEYGRILVSALVILLFVVSASPLGGSIKDGITGVVQSMNRLGSDGEGGSGGGNGGSGSEEDPVSNEPGAYYVDGTFEDWETLKATGKVTEDEAIKRLAFYGNRELVRVVMKDGTTSIGDFAFNDCRSLTSVTIPEGTTKIGENAFFNCTGLTSVTIPSTVTSMGRYAFTGCTGLTSITISEGTTTIGESAFSGCTDLTSVTIPSTVTSIDRYAFKDCSGLTSVYFKQTTAPTFGEQCFWKSSLDSEVCTFYFKNSTVADAFKDDAVYYLPSFGIKSTDYSW